MAKENPLDTYLQEIRDKNIHVVGLSGAEGAAIARFLVKHRINGFTCHDFRSVNEFRESFFASHLALTPQERETALKELLDLPIKVQFKGDYLAGILDADLIFVGQNWFNYSCNTLLFQAREQEVPFFDITRLYFHLAPCPIVGITGTKGKTTTTSLLHQILSLSHFRSYLAGNSQYSLQILEKVDAITPEDILVLEISNRQLIDLKKSPKIGIITNIFPDHIKEHGTFSQYRKVKESLFAHQKEDDYAIINFDNEFTRDIADRVMSQVIPFSTKTRFSRNGVFCRDNEIVISQKGNKTILLKRSDIQLLGVHNLENVLAAAAAACLLGVSPDIIRQGVLGFKGVKNRLELIREAAGVKFYNDMSSTTPSSTMVALKVFSSPVILIAGGEDKGGDYDRLAEII